MAVIGAGYWGKNLVRNFCELGVLECVCDTNEEALRAMRQKYGVRTATVFDTVLREPEIQAVVIATPLRCSVRFHSLRFACRGPATPAADCTEQP